VTRAFKSALACAAILVAGQAAFADAARYRSPAGSFTIPSGWKAEKAADVTGDAQLAVRLVAPPSPRRPIVSATVLVSARRIGEAALESQAGSWHAAHLRNRVAWGMRSAGGLPRDLLRLDGRRAIRYRDQVGSALGASEQTFTCLIASGHLACVVISAEPSARDAVDQLSAKLLASLSLR
jgi:hypothetical protein